MSGKAIGETLAAFGVMASMVFVGLEIRQNTIMGRAAAYQEIGFNAATGWAESARDRSFSELEMLSRDSMRLDEIDAVGWNQLGAMMTSVMRGWETVYLQVQEGLLPADAMRRLGYGVNYWPTTFERLWPDVRVRMDEEFASYVERQFGLDP